jgi:hypothetical protein
MNRKETEEYDKFIYDIDGKSEGKRSLGIPRRMWEDNIKGDITEI